MHLRTAVPFIAWLCLDLLASGQGAPVIREGWDWALPANVGSVPYSGYITWGEKRFDPAITVRGVMMTWKQLNPAPGQYDWNWARAQIAKNRAAGMRTGIHLKGVERTAVPDWVVEKFKPTVLDVPPLQDGQPWRIQIVPPWQPEVDRAFHEFMREFAKTGIARGDDVVYGYIHGVSASRGEEMFIRPVDLELWQKTTGVTAAQFADWLRRRIDAMCEVFKGSEHKLAVMWGGPLGPTDEFRAATADLHEYAFKKGAGIRGGGIDFMHGLVAEPAWASSLDPRGYMLVDDGHPTIKGGRFRGDENEEYGKYWEWRFGPVEGYPYRHRICVLRGLQMRQNFQLVSPETLKLNPELNEYARITQGYRRENSPDAWAYLREFYRGKRAVRNIERWLIQRDLPGSETVPAERVDRHPLPSERFLKGEMAHDFDARRTDIAHGQSGLLFSLDKVFWAKPGPATIKVTYADGAPSSWHIAYTGAADKALKSETVRNSGDGKRKTVTFHVPVLVAAGRFPDDAAFLAATRGEPKAKGSAVANGDFAKGAEGWSGPAEYRVVADPERPGRKMVEYQFKAGNTDTVHMDQLVRLEKGIAYRLRASIRCDGERLKPGVRVGGMDWSTIAYVESVKSGSWEDLSATFRAEQEETIRLQLFGQGRGHNPEGQSGKAHFRDIAIEPIPAGELMGDTRMDFRIVNEGPGDLVVTMVRVIKGRCE
ncbi:MAG TPA: hypothetical protein PLU30_18380 [Verrucomicrobiae bacterium]|nr:hypothetical protein [Verrucomicrobiae bacterium]